MNYLTALNHVLSVVGEAPVSDPDSMHPTILAAKGHLDNIIEETLDIGWWFNEEYNLVLSPDISGNIFLPADTLSISIKQPNAHLVQRGSKLYDPLNHTFNIGTSVTLDVVLKLDFKDLPEVCSNYIKHYTAYTFYINDDGDDIKSRRLEALVMRAWSALREKHLRAVNTQALSRPKVLNLKYRMASNRTDNPNYPGGGL